MFGRTGHGDARVRRRWGAIATGLLAVGATAATSMPAASAATVYEITDEASCESTAIAIGVQWLPGFFGCAFEGGAIPAGVTVKATSNYRLQLRNDTTPVFTNNGVIEAGRVRSSLTTFGTLVNNNLISLTDGNVDMRMVVNNGTIRIDGTIVFVSGSIENNGTFECVNGGVVLLTSGPSTGTPLPPECVAVFPTITAPTIVTANAPADSCSALVAPPSITVTGNPQPQVTLTPSMPREFPVGTAQVTVSAQNAAFSDPARATFDVVVRDVTPPTIDVPIVAAVEATGPNGAAVTFPAPTATDNCPGVVVTTSRASGSTFPLGTTQVLATATDASDNAAPRNFPVRVVDTTKPTITLTSRTAANAAGWNNGPVTLVWACNDIVGVALPTVTSTVTQQGANRSGSGSCSDTSSNSVSDTVTGINIDTTAPTLNPTVTPIRIPVGGTGQVIANAGDALSGIATVECGTLDTSAAVTRSVTCTATDVAGNSTTKTVDYDVVWACGTVSGTEAQLRAAGYTVHLGGIGPDNITGTKGNDFILANGGDDIINALGGNDVICAGSGIDIVDAGVGADQIDGGFGNDTLNGASGNDTINGGSGNDTINGGDGNDRLYGNDDDDTLTGGANTDTCDGGIGIDTATTCETRVKIP